MPPIIAILFVLAGLGLVIWAGLGLHLFTPGKPAA